MKKACLDGDDKLGIMTIGQVVGILNDVPTCKELFERMVAEAEEIIEATWTKVLA